MDQLSQAHQIKILNATVNPTLYSLDTSSAAKPCLAPPVLCRKLQLQALGKCKCELELSCEEINPKQSVPPQK